MWKANIFWQPCVSVLLCSFSPGLPLPVFCPSLPLLCPSVIFPSFSFPPFITFAISFHPNLPPSKFFHFFYFILPSSCPLSSFCSYSSSFPLSPFSPIFSLPFSFLYFSPYPSLLSYILFSPTLLMSPIFLPKWEFPTGWWTPHKQPLCNSCPWGQAPLARWTLSMHCVPWYWQVQGKVWPKHWRV